MISGNRACNKYIHVNQHYDLVILWQRLLESRSTYYQQDKSTYWQQTIQQNMHNSTVYRC